MYYLTLTKRQAYNQTIMPTAPLKAMQSPLSPSCNLVETEKAAEAAPAS
jgi:hypothetical protein